MSNVPALRQLVGNLTVAAHLRGQRELPYADPARLHALRDRRLRRMVRFATRRVPFYRELFARMGLDPRDLRGARDLRALPLLAKSDVRADPDRFTAGRAARRHGLTIVTSGTTGERCTILHDRASLLANVAYGLRERDVLGRLLAGRSGRRQVLVAHASSTVFQVWDFYARHTWIPVRPERTRLLVEEPLERVVAAATAARPDLLLGYGSYLELLFRAVATHGWKMHRPRAVVYGADAMSADGRHFLEHDLGIAVASIYSAAEVFKLGFSCEAGDGFHVHEDLCHVRLVDAEGRDVPPGVPGEVVISNLVNRGTVLLNYRLGDVATWADAPCPCGRTLPRLATLEGRREDVLALPGGRLLHPRAVWNLVKQWPDVLRFQLVQREPALLELRLMTRDRTAYDRVAPSLAADLRGLAGEVVIRTVYAEEIDVHGGGKFCPVVALRQASG